MARKKKKKPNTRDSLVGLTRGMGVDESAVSDAELDELVAKLDSIKSPNQKMRFVMEKLLPFLSERLEAAIDQMNAKHAAQNPSQN